MKGHVIAVGVINFVFAAIMILCGLGMFVAGGMIMSALGAGGQMQQQMQAEVDKAMDKAVDEGDMDATEAAEARKAMEAAGGIAGLMGMFGTAVVSICGIGGLVFGLLYLFAGLGCVKLKGYGRVLTIILAILQVLLFALSLMGGIQILNLLIGGAHIYMLVIMFNGATGALFREGGRPATVEA